MERNMTKSKFCKAIVFARKDVKILLDELLAEKNETHQGLITKLGLPKSVVRKFKQGKIFSLPLLYKIAKMYGKEVNISLK